MTPLYIVIHDSVSVYGNQFMIDDWHAQRGFSYQHKYSGTALSFGYHYAILNGRVWSSAEYEEIHDGVIVPGRPENAIGAHCRANGRNMDSLGIVLLGPPFTSKQSTSLIKLSYHLKNKYKIETKNIRGHKEEDPKKKKDPRIDMKLLRSFIDDYEGSIDD